MALEATFKSLRAHLQTLSEALSEARTTVVEDRPQQGDSVLIDVFGDALEDLLGWLAEGRVAADRACQAAATPADLLTASQALGLCHDRCLRVSQGFWGDTVSFERLSELSQLGAERRGAWFGWSREVRDALTRCRGPLYALDLALVACWQELAERIGSSSVTVHASSAGKISVHPPAGEGPS